MKPKKRKKEKLVEFVSLPVAIDVNEPLRLLLALRAETNPALELTATVV
jgi:hypothetical protein